jgi:hypothetical protein
MSTTTSLHICNDIDSAAVEVINYLSKAIEKIAQMFVQK